jgi:hypothetical protein
MEKDYSIKKIYPVACETALPCKDNFSLMKAVAEINKRWGRDTIQPGAAGLTTE